MADAALFVPALPDLTLRLYALVRSDLEMPPGKAAAQAGHAFLEAFLETQRRDPHRAALYAADPPGTKVVLAAPTLDALLRAEARATELGIPVVRITDSGHVLPPHFTGAPVVTALGLGPATRFEVQRLTRRYPLIP